ncbi:MAG TPA: pyridoxal-dependent decarboxylase [Candidatus Krumholzibacteria bacterium]|nr:pyridoxal-dependent decarboxylase [Candidatus Krumholzibacteria bacterium]
MDAAEFRRHGHEIIDWIAAYLETNEQLPVMARTEPGSIAAALPAQAPERGESMDAVMEDFHRLILPGITHWNHPRFFAYFPANNSYPSILGELLSAGLGVNAMLWQTSPAATELEQVVMRWLAQLVGLPAGFHGCIQDTASTATLTALVCARERSTGFLVGTEGFAGADRLRIYISRDAHSSVIKGARIAGFGDDNVVLVDVDANRAMDVEDLERRIRADRAAGYEPCCIVATVGTTSTTAVDPVHAIGLVAQGHDLWLHVDAALAGTAAILPDRRWILDGIERADSLVFNPHKWMFTNFDCSAWYVKDPAHLERTMSIDPEYLKTNQDGVVRNFRDWGVPLGRRFRALKLWFVLRTFGAGRLREMVAAHLELAQEFAGWIDAADGWERTAPVPLNTVCFRLAPAGADLETCNRLNKALLDRVNAEGTTYITLTKLDGLVTLRLAIGQTRTERRHVVEAWDVLQRLGREAAAG